MAKAERAKSGKPRKAPKLPRELVAAIRAAEDKKAEDLVVLDLEKAGAFTDYFVIATGRNPRQTAAIWDEVHGRLKQENGLVPRTADGTTEGTWVLADYLDVVLHVFTPEARDYYKLEDLWGDVPAVELAEVAAG